MRFIRQFSALLTMAVFFAIHAQAADSSQNTGAAEDSERRAAEGSQSPADQGGATPTTEPPMNVEEPFPATPAEDASLQHLGETEDLEQERAAAEALLQPSDTQVPLPDDEAAVGGVDGETTPDEQEEPTADAESPFSAGPGFFDFFDFGRVPQVFNNVSLNNLPYGGLPVMGSALALRQIGPVRYGGGLATGVSLTDNAEGSSTDRQSDAIWTVTPSLYLETGVRNKIRLLYSPSLQQSMRSQSDNNAVNQTFLLTGNYSFSKLHLDASFGYVTRTGLFVETEGVAEQTSYVAGLNASYPLGFRTTVSLSYGFSAQNSDPGGVQFGNDLTGSLGYQLTPRTSVGGYLSLGSSSGEEEDPTQATEGSSSGQEDQTYATAGLNASYTLTDRLNAFASVGIQVRQLSATGAADGLTTPVFNLGANWNPAKTISVNAGLSRGVSNNSFESSQTNITTSANLGVSIRLWQKLSLGLIGSLGYIEQISDSDSDAADSQSDRSSSKFRSTNNYGDSRYVFSSVGLNASYPLTRNISLSANYFYTLQGPSEQSDGYDRNVVGLSISWTF
jgi:Putative beta-barrel porin 2